MTSLATMPDPARTPDPVDALLQILGAQCEAHRRLLALLTGKRAAIRAGDIEAIAAACDEEQRLVHALGETEARRRTLVAHLTTTLRPDCPEPLPLTELAAALDATRGARLREIAATLRDAVGAVRRESAVVTAAADALARHLAGVMQTVQGALSRAGTYERKGRIAVPDHAHCCVDLRS